MQRFLGKSAVSYLSIIMGSETLYTLYTLALYLTLIHPSSYYVLV